MPILDERNNTFDPKDPEEVITLSFDFTVFGSGFSSPVCTVTHLEGVADADAGDMASVGIISLTAGILTQQIEAGVHGADYLVRAKVSQNTNVFVISGVLPVRNAVGKYSQSEIID
jgi:hypothetical protein